MLSRLAHPAGTLGRAAGTLLGPLRTIAVPTWRLASLISATQTQTRFSSSRDTSQGIPHLQPPWQVSDLSRFERELYKEHGPNYADHVSTAARRLIMLKAKQRARQSTRWHAQFGDDWYEIVKEANKINRQKWKARNAGWFQRHKFALARLVKAKKAPPSTDQAVEIQLARDELKAIEKEQRSMREKSSNDMRKITEKIARSRGVGKTEES